MFHKRWRILLAPVILCLCLVGCAASEEKEKEAAAWRGQAEELAITYIEEKYGFTPQVVDSKSDLKENIVPVREYDSRTLITMMHEDRTFIVLADGDEKTTEHIIDNYQEEEIIENFQAYLSEYFEVPVYDVHLESADFVTIPGDRFDLQYNFFHEYYDGTNLEELLTKHALRGHAKLVGDITLDDWTFKEKDSVVFHEKTELLLTTHNSEDDADKCTLGAYFDDTVYTHAMYLTDALDIRNGEITEYNLSVGQYGGMYYLCPDMDASEYILSTDTDTVDVSNWEYSLYSYQKTGEASHYISGDFTAKSPEIYIYYPTELLPKKPDGVTGYRMGVSFYKIGYDKCRYERYEGVSVGDFEVYEISLKNKEDISFRLLFELEK